MRVCYAVYMYDIYLFIYFKGTKEVQSVHKGTVHPTLKFHPFSTHHCIIGGSIDMFFNHRGNGGKEFEMGGRKNVLFFCFVTCCRNLPDWREDCEQDCGSCLKRLWWIFWLKLGVSDGILSRSGLRSLRRV